MQGLKNNHVLRAAVAAAVCAASLALAQPSLAQAAQKVRLDIPAQDLSAALTQFGRETRTEIVFSPEAVREKRAAAVKGEFERGQALKVMLEGTGVTYRVTAQGAIVIESAMPSAAAAQGSAMRLASNGTGQSADASGQVESASATASAEAARADQDEVVVTGKRFNYEYIEGANKIPMSVKDTPQSVKVITEDVMEFAGVRQLRDSYKVDASTHASPTKSGFPRNYFRGFLAEGDNAYKLDGMRGFGRFETDMATVERVEIVKGATTTMYGHAVVGGTLNAVSKKPKPEFGGSASVEAGSYDHYRGVFDVHGALTSSEKLSGRLIASYLDEEGPEDFFYRKSKVLAPSLKYEFSPETSLTLLTQYQDLDYLPIGNFGMLVDRTPAARYPSEGSAYHIPDVPRSRYGGNPDGFSDNQMAYGRLLLEHKFAGTWQLRANAQYARNKYHSVWSQAVTTFSDTNETDIEVLGDQGKDNIRFGEINVYGNVTIGGREHTLFFGADYYKRKAENYYPYAWLPGEQTGFSLINPDYSLLPRLSGNLRDFVEENTYLDPYALYHYVNTQAFNTSEVGYVAQAILRPSDKLTVLLGARYSQFDTESTGNCCGLALYDDPFPWDDPDATESYKNHAPTYQVGVTYAVTPRVNVYASYGQTFEPRNSVQWVAEGEPGKLIRPEEGDSYEIGVKGDVAEGTFSWSADVFQTSRTNITEIDPFHGWPFYVVLGEQRARGVELDFQGEIRKGWSVYVSAATMKNEFVKGEFKGFTSFFAPKFGLSTFTSYQIQGGPARGLGFGGGAVFKKVRDVRDFYRGPLEPLDMYDDVFEVDARVFYERGPWSYGLSITNLLDDSYFSPSYQSPYFALKVNPGRQFFGTMTYRF